MTDEVYTDTVLATRTKIAGTCYGWAGFIILVGIAVCYMGLDASTTAPYSDTLNIGLMQNQLIVTHGGIALVAAGIVGMFIAALIDVIERRT